MTEPKPGKSTKLVNGGRRKQWRGRLVNPPVERASTILFDDVGELDRARPGLGQYNYGLQGTATHWALSEALTELEPGAAGTALYSAGLAAISGALLAVLSAGDELLVVDSVYGPTRKFCDTILKRFGIAVRYYHPLVGSAIAELFTDGTRAILLESPGSLTMEVQDVPGICAVARERDIEGSSGLFSFEFKGAEKEKRAAFVDSLELFGIGYSWGGYESLALPVDPYRTVSKAPAPNLVRLHIGLEDPDDLIADLAAAFAKADRSS